MINETPDALSFFPDFRNNDSTAFISKDYTHYDRPYVAISYKADFLPQNKKFKIIDNDSNQKVQKFTTRTTEHIPMLEFLTKILSVPIWFDSVAGWDGPSANISTYDVYSRASATIFSSKKRITRNRYKIT